jgi:hypothetical protein
LEFDRRGGSLRLEAREDLGLERLERVDDRRRVVGDVVGGPDLLVGQFGEPFVGDRLGPAGVRVVEFALVGCTPRAL